MICSLYFFHVGLWFKDEVYVKNAYTEFLTGKYPLFFLILYVIMMHIFLLVKNICLYVKCYSVNLFNCKYLICIKKWKVFVDIAFSELFWNYTKKLWSPRQTVKSFQFIVVANCNLEQALDSANLRILSVQHILYTRKRSLGIC